MRECVPPPLHPLGRRWTRGKKSDTRASQEIGATAFGYRLEVMYKWRADNQLEVCVLDNSFLDKLNVSSVAMRVLACQISLFCRLPAYNSIDNLRNIVCDFRIMEGVHMLAGFLPFCKRQDTNKGFKARTHR